LTAPERLFILLPEGHMKFLVDLEKKEEGGAGEEEKDAE